MREILFRGKRIRQNDEGIIEWVYGHYYDVYGVPNIEQNNKSFDVDPETIGQYTGLNKNGKKIFEGDIVTVYVDYGGDLVSKNKNDIGVVRWDNELSRYYVKGKTGIYYAIKWIIEVIGNKFDNPELLEVEE